MEKSIIEYIIFQIKHTKLSRGRIFFELPDDQMLVDFKKDGYENIYHGTICSTKESALNDIFVELNVHYPIGYKGRSLSVSDIVKVNNKYYHCQSFDWKEITPINHEEIENF